MSEVNAKEALIKSEPMSDEKIETTENQVFRKFNLIKFCFWIF